MPNLGIDAEMRREDASAQQLIMGMSDLVEDSTVLKCDRQL